jgi:hypothetical protein
MLMLEACAMGKTHRTRCRQAAVTPTADRDLYRILSAPVRGAVAELTAGWQAACTYKGQEEHNVYFTRTASADYSAGDLVLVNSKGLVQFLQQ